MDIGVDDLILLEQIDQQSVLKMLQYRYSNDIIYTSIGNVIISLNPYKEIRDLYTKELALMYRQCEILKPHIYTLAQAAILDLNSWQRDQCVIISGESGAGKTEASKIFLSYIALQDTTSNTKQIENQLVLSNNILEAFGNAKTIRNDNSSRFGKYMDLRFSNNLAVGGHILAYLLEKSRVVNVGLGERNYHIFYLILSGLSPTQLETYSITSDPSKFRFLAKSGCYNTTINDKERFDSFISALRALGFTISDINDIYATIAAILLLGNLDFSPVEKETISTGRETCQVENKQLLKTIANHLYVNPSDLESALTFRSIKDNNKNIKNDILVPLSLNEADFSRNALAKATYMRLFNHVIDKINTSMQPSIKEKTNSIGVLDIFGFEVFEQNSFEQFVINYGNEKLQHYFISLTLKTEQEEYLAQEIEWTGVKYFDNQVICDLIETKPTGILSLLNEETTMPGEPTDLTFLEKLDTFLIKNDYYDSFTKNKNDKQLVPGMFRIKHYAGDVNYNVQNFLEKNRDELYKDLVTCMSKSKSKMIAQMFVQEDINNAKRPETLATQVRQSINTLLAAIKQKNPHYIRCIRPNSHKCAKNFDLDYVGDQWRYLGLQENIHVKRAGFCFRQEYTTFLYQFKMLAKETWPFYKGTSQTGVQLILNAMEIPSMEYAFGKSMIFIKSPQSVRKLEASRLATKHLLTTKIQRMWKSYAIRRTYKRLIKCSIQIQAWYRMCQSRQEYTKKQNAAKIITKIYRGHLARKNVKKLMSKLPRFAAVTIQKSYRKYVVRKFLKDLKHDVKRAGAKWVSIKWPSVSQPLQEASDHLFKIYRQLKATQVCKPLLTSPVLHAAIRMKISAYNLFSQKASIKKSLKSKYEKIDIAPDIMAKITIQLGYSPENILYASGATKLNRHNPTTDKQRYIVLSKTKLYLIEPSSLNIKDALPISDIGKIAVSFMRDGVMVFKTNKSHTAQNDCIIRNDEKCIHFLTIILEQCEPKVELEISNTIIYKCDAFDIRISFEQVSTPSGQFMIKQTKNNYVAQIYTQNC